ncbi:EF-hand calcium-binding domain-containing protein 6 [Leptonychotes weddellii]|uniref:EF-hand calcium-binding domain-containing protein 6 n=1 Tax=Leptonychotes weddellii TaxID=9713 RepID=A0A7F8S0K1_LEPWE|nr:EF-hand calcium-binding domain-containing protein 6 [Leptonychotes weddellii]
MPFFSFTGVLVSSVGGMILKNIKTVIKAFKLIDVNKTGLIQPCELRKVLETFCLKMKDDEYRKTIGKIHQSGKKRFVKHYNIDKDTAVDYNVFLKNLSVNNDLNLRYSVGNQEISWNNQPVKNSKGECLHSSVSSEDVWKNCSLDEIERTFCQELPKSYEKVEKALSAGDPSKSGYVSLNYLKIVFDTFVYRLPRRIFIQLMKRFGLKTTSKINWKQFLTSLYDSQWLEVNNTVPLTKRNSITSRNQSRKENILTKLPRHEDHYTSLKKALLIANTKPDGRITGEELRRLLNCMVVKISDSEFKELMQTLDPGDTGWVNVYTLIELLEENPKVEEIVQDSITRNLQAFYKMLQSYDLGDTGLIGRNNFKKIMRIFCPFLTIEHLLKLCSKFQDIASGKILYKKLLACMGISGPPTISPVLVPKGQLLSERFQKEEQLLDVSERTKPTEDRSTLAKNMTKDEVIEKLKNHIQQRDPAFRKTFLDFSKELNGKINVRDFKKVLEASGMPMDDDQYALLTAKIGYQKEGMSYLDFAAGFEDAKMKGPEVTPLQTPVLSKNNLDSYFITAEECLKQFPQRLKEAFRVGVDEAKPKQKVADSELACEQAHQYLVTKAKTRWSDLSKNFIETDNEGNGILRRRDIKNALYGFDIPLTPREFEKLWMSYDTEGRGHITYQEFVQKLGINYSADIHRPYAEDYFNFMGHFTKPQQMQEEVKQLEQSTDRAAPVREKFKDHYQDISKALTKLDRWKNGYISIGRMQKVLQECGCSLKEEELTDLLHSWGISWHDNSFNYLDFLKAVESSKPIRPQPKEKEENTPVNFSTLDPEDVVKNIQEVVASSDVALSTV